MSDPRKSTGPTPIEIDTLHSVTGGEQGSERGWTPDPNQHHQGGDGRDMIFAGSGDDTIDAGGGNDFISGGGGDDVINAGAGDDTIRWVPAQGNDSVDGGEGTDRLIIDATEISLEEVLAAITLAPGSAQPTIVDGAYISLAGVSGTLTIGGSTITFTNLERLVVPEAPRPLD